MASCRRDWQPSSSSSAPRRSTSSTTRRRSARSGSRGCSPSCARSVRMAERAWAGAEARSGAELALSDREAVLAELRAAERLIVVSHENPDGDALGSLVAMQQILTQLGKDSLMYIGASDFPLPHEYAFLPLAGRISLPPGDLEERTAVFLDCRNPAEALKRPGAHILNIDHHHDNTRFGTVNLVVPEASCTAEIVWDLMHDLGVSPTQAIAEAL